MALPLWRFYVRAAMFFTGSVQTNTAVLSVSAVYVSQTSEERLQSHLNTHRQVRGLKKPQPTRSRWGNVKSKSLGPGSHRGVFARRKSSGATRQPSLGALGSMLVSVFMHYFMNYFKRCLH